MSNLYELTIKEAFKQIKSGKITSELLTKSCLDRIKEKEPEISAFVSLFEDKAISDAKKIDIKIKNKEKLSKLAGIPYSLKDVYVTKTGTTTACSNILKNYEGQYNATVHKKLQEAGAILLGKTNCDPFGFGSSTEHSAFGPTKNPIDTSRVPGGSSGGSAAAVAYGGGLFSIGEDTGGSIRCPASFCGIDGLKVTYGRVSRYGSIAYASSYDSVGPFAKTSEDLALVMEVIAGKDSKDATTSPEKVPEYEKFLNKNIKGTKIGLPKEYYTEGVDEDVIKVIDRAKERFKKLGCTFVDVSLPYTDYAVAAYYVVGLSEASSNLARYDGVRYGLEVQTESWQEKYLESRGRGFSDEAKRRIMIGTYALSKGYADKFYKKAQKVRQLLKKDFARVLKKVDVILTPTMPVLPFKFGENTDDPLKMWLLDAFTVSVNPVGVPALSVNAGYTDDGLPVGMQIIGDHFSEEFLLNLGHAYENNEI